MITLRQDGWRKVLAGKTTIDEVARVTAADSGVNLHRFDACVCSRDPTHRGQRQATMQGEALPGSEFDGNDAMKCPRCQGRMVAADDVNLEHLIAKCRACQEVFRFSPNEIEAVSDA